MEESHAQDLYFYSRKKKFAGTGNVLKVKRVGQLQTSEDEIESLREILEAFSSQLKRLLLSYRHYTSMFTNFA